MFEFFCIICAAVEAIPGSKLEGWETHLVTYAGDSAEALVNTCSPDCKRALFAKLPDKPAVSPQERLSSPAVCFYD